MKDKVRVKRFNRYSQTWRQIEEEILKQAEDHFILHDKIEISDNGTTTDVILIFHSSILD